MVTKEKNRSSEDVLKEQQNILDTIERSKGGSSSERGFVTMSPKGSPKRSRAHQSTATYRADRASLSIYDTDGPGKEDSGHISADSTLYIRGKGHKREGSSSSSKSADMIGQPLDNYPMRGMYNISNISSRFLEEKKQ